MIRYGGEAYLGIKLGQESIGLKDQVWVLTAVAFGFSGVVYLAARWNRRRRAGAR